jgi:hypothetical protein
MAAPVSNVTGHHEVVFTLFTISHWRLASNARCSAKAAGLPEAAYIFIALDAQAYAQMIRAKREVLLLNTSALNYSELEITRLNFVILWHLLTWQIDPTIAEADIVFIRNPLALFQGISHAEVAVNDFSGRFHGRFDFSVFNIGFVHVISSQKSVRFWKKLIAATFDSLNQPTQVVMMETLRPVRVGRNRNPIQQYDLSAFVGQTDTYTIRFYDPFEVMNCGLLVKESDSAVRVARERKFERPYLVHAAFVELKEREAVLTARALWFVDVDAMCMNEPPVGTVVPPWREVTQSPPPPPRGPAPVPQPPAPWRPPMPPMPFPMPQMPQMPMPQMPVPQMPMPQMPVPQMPMPPMMMPQPPMAGRPQGPPQVPMPQPPLMPMFIPQVPMQPMPFPMPQMPFFVPMVPPQNPPPRQ